MSTPTILPGQFYRMIPEGDSPILGWTVMDVASGYLGEGTTDHGLARMWVIRNDTRTATPELKDYSLVEKWVKDAVWTHANGPIKPAVGSEDLPEEVRKKIEEIEERRYQLIRPILELGEDAFWPHVRRTALKKRALEVSKSVDYLWQLLCLYWQLGGRIGLRPRAVLAGQKSLAHRVKVACEKAKADKSGKTSPADHFKVYKTGPKPTEGVLEGKPMGYLRRAPSPQYWLNHQAESQALAELDAPPAGRSSAPTFAVIGTSGRGKTTGIDMAIDLFPPVKCHDQSKNPLLPRIQVIVIKITCPVNGTPRSFITEFFDQIHEITGIDYQDAALKRANDDQLIVKMGRIARLHAVGLLVFDEVQEIVGKDERLKKLLLRLTNTIKIPVLFAGTPKAGKVLNKELATARRMTGETWLPFEQNDPDWVYVISELWKYQVTRTPTALTAKLAKKLHELSCGIPALAKSLYVFTQEHLIINSDKGDPELITPDLLTAVFAAKMSSVQPAMSALRSGQGLVEFDDLLPAKLPSPDSWEKDNALADILKSTFQNAAIGEARRRGKSLAQAQLN